MAVRKTKKGLALKRWFKEDWKDVKTGKACGRKKGDKRGTPYCRPTKRVSSKTPKTAGEMTAAQKKKRIAQKKRLGQPAGKPRRVSALRRKRKDSIVRKKIKKAVGGTVASKKFYRGVERGRPVVFSREGMISDIQADEITNLEMQKKALINQHNNTDYGNELMRAVGEADLKKVLKMLDKDVDAKKAGMAATSIYPFKNPIPTLQGTVQDKKTKKETDKYLKKQKNIRALKSLGKNTTKKKAGGRVKKVKAHRGDGIAKRGRTRGRIV